MLWQSLVTIRLTAWINLMCVQAARITLDHLFGSINLPHLFSSTGIHELKLHTDILLLCSDNSIIKHENILLLT